MGLTAAMVIEYLQNTQSLKKINNHDVKDKHDCKTGQLPLTIAIGKQWIDELVENVADGLIFLNEEELNALYRLRAALNSLPVSMGFQAIRSMVSGLAAVQEELLDSIKECLNCIEHFQEYKMLLKALVLVLKITEYDLGKRDAPMKVDLRFFQMEVLSQSQRTENHRLVQDLLTDIFKRFDAFYTQLEEEAEVLDQGNKLRLMKGS